VPGKKRRTKYTWFPTQGTETETSNILAGVTFALQVDSTGSIQTGILPLTFDAPAEGPNLADLSPDNPGVLAGIVGQEYFLRRIVGKFHAYHETAISASDGIPNFANFPRGCILGAGIFVARAGDVDSTGGLGLPIGAVNSDELRESYSPLSASTIREPWIWRRTWLLQNPGPRAAVYNTSWAGTAGFNQTQWPGDYPSATGFYGSALDGPHIDAKTARRVTQDERLWLAVSTTRWPLDLEPANDGAVRGYVDYRILASIRRARNRGVF